jgi:alkylation response protein AidB-like acyl-CoA dehydrogenase
MGGGRADRGLGYACDVLALAEECGCFDDPALVTLIVDDHIHVEVRRQLAERINAGMRTGKLQGPWGSLLKLGIGMDGPIQAEAALAVSASDGVIWTGQNDASEPGLHWLAVRGRSIAGGSNEIQRNIVSERLLGLPREPGQDNAAPFSVLMQKRKSS